MKTESNNKVKKYPAFLNEEWKLFGGINAIFAFAFGVYGYTISFNATHFHFYLTAPILTYYILGYTWKFAIKKNRSFILQLIAVILIFVPLIHYLAYLILIYFDLIYCNFTISKKGMMNYSIGSFTYFFVVAFPFAFYSIYKLYFSTFIIPFAIGFLIKKLKTNKIQ